MITWKPKFNKTKVLKKIKKFKISKGKIAVVSIIVFITSLIFWYNIQLAPVSIGSDQLIKITIEPGSSPTEIGKALKDKSIIRSSFAFDIYTRLSNQRNHLQAGTYRLSPAESTRKIVKHIVNGAVDKFNITFYPGATLTDITDNTLSAKNDVKNMLLKAGYSEAEIVFALNATYDSPLFAGKPSSSTLEGYIYGETYNFNAGASVGEILERTFDEFYSEVQKDNLVEGFASHGLNLFQGITLASIIQREVTNPDDQKIVAQIFYSRLAEGSRLESDVTYQYICDKNGLEHDVNIDSPYNTRRYLGLPPGPISVPGRSALQAVANPATTSYLYFLSGDDDKTYYAYTYEEHQANRDKYCAVKCSKP